MSVLILDVVATDQPQIKAKKVLLVDDDSVVLRIYQEGLTRRGFEVQSAPDGLAAIQALREAKPDAMVLDLMMPKMTGVDVLRFVRSQPALKELPVVVLSNSYMDDLAREAATLGADLGLLKVRCSPSLLARTINDMIEGSAAALDTSELLAAPQKKKAIEPEKSGALAPAAKASHSAALPSSPPGPKENTEFFNTNRRQFFDKLPAIREDLRQLFIAASHAPDAKQLTSRLEDLYRKVHFITAAAGWAGCPQIAQMANAFEALLFELTSKATEPSASAMRTIAQSVDFLSVLLGRAPANPSSDLPPAKVLVVDDDPLSNRLVLAALRATELEARSIEDPLKALELLRQHPFQLVLMDIVMPGMDGFELCKKMRETPGHKTTPVIFITTHTDFVNRAKSALSGGDDLIAKPIFPMELAVKAVLHLLKSHG